MPTHYLYHGSAAFDILDILMYGLQSGEGRHGVSFTTSPARARWWASLKGREVHLLRLIAPSPDQLIPEDAFPADPSKDFTYAADISPVRLQIYADGHWESLFDQFSVALSEEEIEAWQEKWSPTPTIG
jgi:hypothetical protein